jgi:thioredoxin 1
MSLDNIQSGDITTVRYELSLSVEEARQGAVRILSRNGKRLEVVVPSGVITGSLVKLTNALQKTDGKPGDIIINIKLKSQDKTTTDGSTGVVEITDATFSSEVLNANLTVAVDFWAPWCGPCRMMSPVVEQAAELYTGKVKFCKINVDENPSMAAQYQAMSIPMLLFFRNGKMIDKSVGAISLAQLKSKLATLPT